MGGGLGAKLDQDWPMLADCGYTNIETYRPQYEDAEGFRRLLDANGLTAKSGHFALAMAETEFDRVVAIARTLGIETVVMPVIGPTAPKWWFG